jgi:hypothetical protein
MAREERKVRSEERTKLMVSPFPTHSYFLFGAHGFSADFLLPFQRKRRCLAPETLGKSQGILSEAVKISTLPLPFFNHFVTHS